MAKGTRSGRRCKVKASGRCDQKQMRSANRWSLRWGKDLEALASIEIAKHTLVSSGLILACGTLTALLAQQIKIPDVAMLLIVGMLIGPEALGLINIRADSALNQIILLFGASYNSL